MSDDDLLRRAQQGDRAALDEVCRREWRPVYGVLYHAVQNRAEAQDLTQEVFLRALRALDRYEGSANSFHSYLVTIALNLLRDRWKRRTYPSTDLESLPELEARDPGPDELVLADLDRQVVRAALATLPVDYQTVIRLRVVEARPGNEVAELMGRRPDAVRQLQRRALTALRAALHLEAESPV